VAEYANLMAYRAIQSMTSRFFSAMLIRLRSPCISSLVSRSVVASARAEDHSPYATGHARARASTGTTRLSSRRTWSISPSCGWIPAMKQRGPAPPITS